MIKYGSLVLALSFQFACLTESLAAEPVSYSSRVGDSMSYRLTVNVGQGPDANSYDGKLSYKVEAKRGTLIQLKVDGSVEGQDPNRFSSVGLSRTRGSDGSMLPPFDRVNISSVKLGITPYGEVRSTDKDRSMDLFLGTLGQLAIVPLPKENQDQWSSKNTVRLKQVTPTAWPLAFQSPFDRDRESQDGTIADESLQYLAKLLPDGRIQVTHQYILNAEHALPPIKIEGKGQATFDPKIGFVDSLEMTRIIQASNNGAVLQIPVSLTLRRETQEELQAAADASAAAEAKRRAPFTKEERRNWMRMLAPEASQADAYRALGELGRREARFDAEIARALFERGIYEVNQSKPGSPTFLSYAARFDPSLKEVADVVSSYTGFGVVKKTGPPANARFLRAGQIVAKTRKPFSGFEAVKVRNVQGNLVAVVDLRGRNEEVVPITEIRLVPDGIPQPYLQTNSGTRRSSRSSIRHLMPATRPKVNKDEKVDEAEKEEVKDEFVEWKDKTENFRVEAKFVSLDGEVLNLLSKAGKKIRVPLKALRPSDAKRAREMAAGPANPFEVVE